MKKKTSCFSLMLMMLVLVLSACATKSLNKGKAKVVINEIDTNSDWVELTNIGDNEISLDAYYITDDKGNERLTEKKTFPLGENIILKPNEYIVLEKGKDFDFGLGKSDTVMLFDGNAKLVDEYSYSSPADGTWSRQENGTFMDSDPTKGAKNSSGSTKAEQNPISINEINSSPDDWVEIMNASNEDKDISGYELRDNSDDHRWRFPEGSTIEAQGFFAIDAKTSGTVYDDQTKEYKAGTFEEAIGIGSGDSIRLYDKKGTLIDSYSWTKHASFDGDNQKASYGRYPDGSGAFTLTKETKGKKNEAIKSNVVINEIESNGDSTDWVEIINNDTRDVDISGWYILDSDPAGHKSETSPLKDGTVIKSGESYVFDQNKDFTFGLGNDDSVTLYDASGNIVDTFCWTGHANGVYARIPDGSGNLVQFPTSTKGRKNKIINPVVINEVQSNDPNNGPDWIELANPTDSDIDVSNIIIKDSKDKNPYTIKEGTTIKAGEFLVIYGDETGANGFAFGLGKGDSVRLFENGELIAEAKWPQDQHTSPTWGLYPDANGKEYRNTDEATPNGANSFADIPKTISWPGSDNSIVFDTTATFLEDSSGLDFASGKLYAVDNGTAKFWILDEDRATGKLTFSKGFENGKSVSFIKDKDNASAKGPDSEGITVDDDGFIYIASERDNSNKAVNYNTILMVDPNSKEDRIATTKEWDLTKLLPQVSANMGIESVEWISSNDAKALVDKNTNKAFDITNYPNSINKGVFLVALEDNGHVYAFVLNKDQSAILISDIDSRLGGAMALDFDTKEKVLWVASDDGYGNKMAQIRFNGTNKPDIVFVEPASSVDKSANNEGFAISRDNYVADEKRAVYRFRDGVNKGALTIGFINDNY